MARGLDEGLRESGLNEPADRIYGSIPRKLAKIAAWQDGLA